MDKIIKSGGQTQPHADQNMCAFIIVIIIIIIKISQHIHSHIVKVRWVCWRLR